MRANRKSVHPRTGQHFPQTLLKLQDYLLLNKITHYFLKVIEDKTTASIQGKMFFSSSWDSLPCKPGKERSWVPDMIRPRKERKRTEGLEKKESQVGDLRLEFWGFWSPKNGPTMGRKTPVGRTWGCRLGTLDAWSLRIPPQNVTSFFLFQRRSL